MPKVKKTHESRQKEIIPGVGEFSRSAMYKKSGRFAVKNKGKQSVDDAAATTVTKPIGGKGNAGSRTVAVKKSTKYYPVEDIPRPLESRKAARKPTKLRSSITPGTVLILLAGRFRGKRVVFLKQLDSGLLLVTGPFKINGVPLRRVNQAYTIATSTKLELELPNLGKFDDVYFKKQETEEKKKGEEEFFADEAEKKEIAPERITDQKEVDAVVIAAVKKIPDMKDYLNAHFALTDGQYPHMMKF